MDDQQQGTDTGFVAGSPQPQTPAQPQNSPQPKKGMNPIIMILIGIAVLGILVFFVLPIIGAILFSLGIFNPTSGLGGQNTCIAISGFSCYNLSNSGSTMILTFGQNTGTNWQNVTLYTVPSTQQFNETQESNYPSAQSISQLYSGDTASPFFRGGSAGYLLGSGYSGHIYATYSTSNGGPYATEVAIITLKS